MHLQLNAYSYTHYVSHVSMTDAASSHATALMQQNEQWETATGELDWLTAFDMQPRTGDWHLSALYFCAIYL